MLLRMTRINVGIPPKDLSDKHLIAEHREIKRIPNAIKNGRAVVKDIPDVFTLGKGHVKFFYKRLAYLRERYVLLFKECIQRGFNVQDYSSAWDGVPEEYMGQYEPTSNDIKIIKQRIKGRGLV
jgi:deoxyribonuclease (pyrimidine dimer)